jgi:putative ABC transport system permease protein
VAIAIAIAFPAAFWLTERWLMQFPVRVEPSFLSFVLVALMLLATALLSITIQAKQAARRNAVDTLRYE